MGKAVITFGEIMLRLATPDRQRFTQVSELKVSFGGGEANVAVSLANFGIPVQYVTRLPQNDLGRAVIMELRKYDVGTDHILWGGDRLGIYFLETGSNARPSKVIYDRAHSAIAEIKPGMVDWDNVFGNAGWFHWTGITPAISEGAAGACLEAVKKAREKGLTVSCDLNFRKNLWKWGKSASEVMPALVENCDIILGNEEDAEKVFGIKPGKTDVSAGKVEGSQYEEVCRKLKEKFPGAGKIIITLRGSVSADHNTWSGILYNGSEFFHAPVYQITHIVDRVGGGDSFMGGLIYGLLSFPGDDQRALNFAVAASCLKHTIHGDFNLVSVTEVEQLMKGDASGRVVR
ncbi:MAG TPA: sugar kinase [Bacteroidales bacterium]|nr:sugar kinase [Bacteroidales bacterium]HRT89333.1 sugar kinase [Bacteroidales bacterium]